MFSLKLNEQNAFLQKNCDVLYQNNEDQIYCEKCGLFLAKSIDKYYNLSSSEFFSQLTKLDKIPVTQRFYDNFVGDV